MMQPASETRQARISARIGSYFLVSFWLFFSLSSFRSKRSWSEYSPRRLRQCWDALGGRFLGRAVGAGTRSAALGDGQPAGYPRAWPRGGCDDNVSAVQFDEALDEGETETGRRLPHPAFELFVPPRPIGVRDARARIGHSQQQRIFL